jgi:hypothetical protein
VSLSSYSDVFAISHNRGYDEDIQAGDLVSTGPNLFPRFLIVAVSDGKAWVRNVQGGLDSITDLDRCRRVRENIRAAAAE